MAHLGILYGDGQGVPQSYELAVKWYEKAACASHAGAMANLGFLHAKGQGVPQSYELAVKWYEKAACAGDAGS